MVNECPLPEETSNLLAVVEEKLAETYARIQEMEEEIAFLENEGVFDPIPRPSWERRNGKGKYLRLIFPMGVDGKRERVYVGADEERVAAALAKIGRSQEVKVLRFRLGKLRSWLRDSLGVLRSVAVGPRDW